MATEVGAIDPVSVRAREEAARIHNNADVLAQMMVDLAQDVQAAIVGREHLLVQEERQVLLQWRMLQPHTPLSFRVGTGGIC